MNGRNLGYGQGKDQKKAAGLGGHAAQDRFNLDETRFDEPSEMGGGLDEQELMDFLGDNSDMRDRASRLDSQGTQQASAPRNMARESVDLL